VTEKMYSPGAPDVRFGFSSFNFDGSPIHQQIKRKAIKSDQQPAK
jgi:hypothetical protein